MAELSRRQVLKAGAAYVPIDPGYPADRVAYMVEDAKPVLTLTAESLAALDHGPAGPVPVHLMAHTQKAVASCPVLALALRRSVPKARGCARRWGWRTAVPWAARCA